VLSVKHHKLPPEPQQNLRRDTERGLGEQQREWGASLALCLNNNSDNNNDNDNNNNNNYNINPNSFVSR
jgi:hypothetical protein